MKKKTTTATVLYCFSTLSTNHHFFLFFFFKILIFTISTATTLNISDELNIYFFDFLKLNFLPVCL